MSVAAAFTGYKLVAAVGHLAQRDWRNDALLLDALCQFFKLTVAKLLAGLERIGVYKTHLHHAYSHIAFLRYGFKVCDIGQYRSQTAAQTSTLLYCHCFFSFYCFLFLRSISIARLR